MNTKKLFSIFVISLFFLLTIASDVKAVCPVCTVAVAGGLGVSRWLGIDDFISALWIGALCLSITIWGWNLLKKRGKLTFISGVLVLLAVYGMVVYPLYYMEYIGIPLNTLWGTDKILLGTFFGTVLFWIGAYVNWIIKKRNDNKVYFPLQKVVIPFSVILISSLVYYFYCKCAEIL